MDENKSKNNNFGKKLKQIRKSKGLTQEKLAELADVHEKHISKLELGTMLPSFKTLNKILKALDINPQDVGISFEKVSENDNPFYIKILQILNSSSEEEIEYYYSLIKCAKNGLEMLR